MVPLDFKWICFIISELLTNFPEKLKTGNLRGTTLKKVIVFQKIYIFSSATMASCEGYTILQVAWT